MLARAGGGVPYRDHLPGIDVSFDISLGYVTFTVQGIIGTEARIFRD